MPRRGTRRRQIRARAYRRDTIEVEAGDTLYSLSKRYGVSLADLIEANRLHHGTSLKPGQQIVLPAGAVARQARREARAKPSDRNGARSPRHRWHPPVLAASPTADPSAAATAAARAVGMGGPPHHQDG